MIKKRIKNHWDGLNNFEKLVEKYEIYPDGFNANFISIDRINSIQEIIFQVEILLSMNHDIEADLDVEIIEQEFKHLINCISDIQDDFQMHVEELKLKFKNLQNNCELFKLKEVEIKEVEIKKFEIKEVEFENDTKIVEESDEISSENFYFEPLREKMLSEVDSNLVVEVNSKEVESSRWKSKAEMMCCEGFNLTYLNEKNKTLFFKILSRLKNSSNIQFQEDLTTDYLKINANLISDPTFEEVGYLLEMRKYGLGIKII
jgi:hypothetical protein